jgi:hypothetical protein
MRDVNKEFSPWRNHAERKASIAVHQVCCFTPDRISCMTKGNRLPGIFIFTSKTPGLSIFRFMVTSVFIHTPTHSPEGNRRNKAEHVQLSSRKNELFLSSNIGRISAPMLEKVHHDEAM